MSCMFYSLAVLSNEPDRMYCPSLLTSMTEIDLEWCWAKFIDMCFELSSKTREESSNPKMDKLTLGPSAADVALTGVCTVLTSSPVFRFQNFVVRSIAVVKRLIVFI